ncbi:transferrin-binding protein-like solute binding protein [Avibacterium sp. 20-126]|uniref:transferrin-binding protein-like solute binding protein n=1 Tax=Avibacterium sp. 20-126 TaxID=2911524 RepID=UPI00218A31AA|nr:transferrin-binding protein-like solute binding protein [Avibacterium sp. 20-126]
MEIKKTVLCTLTSLFCISCASGGGGFDVENANPPNVVTDNQPSKPNYVTENNGKKLESPAPEDLSEMGWVATTPWGPGRDGNVMNKEYEDVKSQKRIITDARTNLNPKDYDVLLFKGDYPLTHDHQARSESIQVIDENGKKVWKRAVKNISQFLSIGDKKDTLIFYAKEDSANYIYLKITEYGDVKVGFIELIEQDPKTVLPRSQSYNNIFYAIREKTMDMPMKGKATYSGVWEYATYTPQKGSGSGSYYETGKQAGGTLKQNKAVFTVDFSNKTVTGTLDAVDRNDKKIVYDINATITENGFRGNATKNGQTTLFANDGNDNPPLPENAKVLGSFAGEKAKQLAGRVWSEDNHFAGVFAAKQNSEEEAVETDGKHLNAQTLPFTNEENSTTFSENKPQSQNFSGDINKLQIDGILVNLDTTNTDNICCGDFNFLRFGVENHEIKQADNKTEKRGNLFVQGYVTPISEIPSTGEVKYHGHWYGFGKGQAANVSRRYQDAEFTANFATRQVSGELKNNGGTSAVKFENLSITENGFNGKANLAVHDGNITGSGAVITGEADVAGHFYGTNANEIGGTVIKEDKTFGAVFGGKQIQQ